MLVISTTSALAQSMPIFGSGCYGRPLNMLAASSILAPPFCRCDELRVLRNCPDAPYILDLRVTHPADIRALHPGIWLRVRTLRRHRLRDGQSIGTSRPDNGRAEVGICDMEGGLLASADLAFAHARLSNVRHECE